MRTCSSSRSPQPTQSAPLPLGPDGQHHGPGHVPCQPATTHTSSSKTTGCTWWTSSVVADLLTHFCLAGSKQSIGSTPRPPKRQTRPLYTNDPDSSRPLKEPLADTSDQDSAGAGAPSAKLMVESIIIIWKFR